ncbi:unnamed protein product [Adineta steineri]|uniref:PiggyBac transposable element-derived protein domain-containing protein n=1 Tax=Adineta steineri TaxID=433720 RepID=A0A819P6V9_9BILA|nr:unnamed protein product [Adineta steineri]CAF4008226.1 unnamed protein product [Adineta steineri]
MSKKTIRKNHTVIPNGMSEIVDTSESEDEIKKIQDILKNQLVMNNESSSHETTTTTTDSEEEFQQATSKSKSKSKKKKRFHWTKKSFTPPSSTFTENVPPPPSSSEPKPIEYFYSMFGKNSINILKDQSNLYSVQQNPNRPVNITDIEIHQFIGILIMTSVYCFPQQRFYWTYNTRIPSIASAMSRDRFLRIKKNLHVVDNTNQLNPNDPTYDRAFKVRPLLNIVKENFRQIPKEEHLSIDEQIIPFKGKSVMKQHMPNKPNRWEYKMYLLCGGNSGICYDYELYTGKSNQTQHGFCTDIVLKLSETSPRMKNHKVYFDNYFTTIRLQVELYKLGIFSAGTARTNRLSDLVMKDAKSLEQEGRGAMDHRIVQVDGVVVCATRWFDNNIVNCISTLYGCESHDFVKRWSASQKQHIQVKRPNVIKFYNQYMGRVDLMDMLISLYRINIGSKKYYIKIIFQLIDLSIANGWLLYRRHCDQLRLAKNEILSLLQFRMAVADDLLKPVAPEPPVQRGRPTARLQSKKKSQSKQRRALTTQHPLSSTRRDGFHH